MMWPIFMGKKINLRSLIKKTATIFFNRLQIIYHPHTQQEINLIKNTGLFNHLDAQQFKNVINSARLEKYIKNSLVFKEGDLPNALYVILDGSVRVFTYDANAKKIPLSRLNKGDYFGEQALVGPGLKTRNASIETIEDATLIRINARSIIPFWQKDNKLLKKLRKIGFRQAIQALSASTKLYNDIQPIIESIKNCSFIEAHNNQVIFNAGDKPDHVYLILQGKIKLLISQKNLNKTQCLILLKGHLFGELGVLENKPRAATAIAQGNVRLLVINGKHFKQVYNKNPALRHLFSSLKQTYQLPMQGVVEQFFGSSDEIGSTITSIFKLSNERTIISIRSLVKNIFTMSELGAKPGIKYKYEKGQQEFTCLTVVNKHLVAIESSGEWDDLAEACRKMLTNEVLEVAVLNKFTETGELASKVKVDKGDEGNEGDKVICTCMSVTRSCLQNLIDKGVKDLNTLSEETGACTVCGSCECKILEMLGENPWLAAIMERSAKHNSYIHSYHIKLMNSQFKAFEPGQHIIIKVKVHDNWLERPYTISEKYSDNSVRVTVKKESNGLFSQWIFNEAPEKIYVNVSNPQGAFTLNSNVNVPALCFAGGIGITPFIMYVKSLIKLKSHKPMHILYCAHTKDDFILMDEFTEATHLLSSINIIYRDTESNGSLTKDEIINLIKSLSEPDIYICGPKGFENLISSTLRDIAYDQAKIHIEQFFPVGTE